MNLRSKFELFKEIFLFVKEKKQWILIPVLIMLCAIILLAVFIETPVLLPFFYALF